MNPELPQYLVANPILGQRLTFHPDCTVTIRPGKVEIGQGIVSAIAQIAAEELDIDYARVHILPVDSSLSPNEASTSGSRSIQEGGESMRFACAEIRHLFLEAAAAQFSCSFTELSIHDGVIHHLPSQLKTSYWDLLDKVDLDVLANGRAAPKLLNAYQIVGTSLPRKDLLAKLSGAAFLQDLHFPGMLHARIARPPSFRSKLAHFNEAPILAMPGVKKVVRNGSFIGIVAQREEDAIRAMLAVNDYCEWLPGPPLPDIHHLPEFLYAQVSKDEVLKQVGTLRAQFAQAATPLKSHHPIIHANFSRPYLAHASIGPSCAIAFWQNGLLEIWSHSQSIHALRDAIAATLLLQPNQVVVRHADGAGCYGHNGADDAALDAALIAYALEGTHIRVQWTRADEFAWEPFGPAMAVKLSGSVDHNGQINHWQEAIWGNGHIGRAGRRPEPGLLAAWHIGEGVDPPLPVDMPIAMGGGSQRNAVPYYDLPNCEVINHVIQTMPIRTSALRALGAFINVFAIESFMDELALQAGIDPIQFRIQHLSDARAIHVLQKVRQMASCQPGVRGDGVHGVGVAFARYKNVGNYAAVIVEVAVEEVIKVKKVYAAIDCGRIINPNGVMNQIEGGILQSISFTLKEQLKFDRTKITSITWDDYPILTFSEVPEVEVALIDQMALPAIGVGEGVTGPIPAAIANAVFDAIGVRVRNLPMTQENVIAAMEHASSD